MEEGQLKVSALVTDGLEYWAKTAPEDPAIIMRDRQVSYRELHDRAVAVAHELRSRGLRGGDLVGMIAENTYESCVLTFGVLLAAGILAPYNSRFLAPEIRVLVEQGLPAMVLAVDARRAVMDEVAATSTVPFELVRAEDLLAAPVPGDTWDRSHLDLLDGTEPAFLVYTSGSTGTPKGVIHTHLSSTANVYEWAMLHNIAGRQSRVLGALPMATAAGVWVGLVHATTRGGSFVLEPSFDPPRALEAITAHRITTVFGPPIIFEALAAAPGFAEADLSSIELALVAGARVPRQLMDTWLGKGVKLRQGYGQSEAGTVTITDPAEAERHPEACGRGGIFTRVKVVRPDGTECASGEPGEIVLRGPSVAAGYWRDEQATAKAYVDGWLHTGDVGAFDSDGLLHFVDRIKELIISGGFNISPREIEEKIQSYLGVVEVAVIPVADAEWGETPAAIIYASQPIDTADLIASLRTCLAGYKIPRYVEVLDKPLVRSPSGKLNKRELGDTYHDIASTHAPVR
jgi:fatty-acyl-CoA synthase